MSVDLSDVINSLGADAIRDVRTEFLIARDGERLAYSLYSKENAKVCLIFYHGSSARHEYLRTFAEHVAGLAGIDVCTPTQRGHGDNPKRRGDIDYESQLADDTADFIRELKKRGYEKFFIGGHSSGGGYAMRILADQEFMGRFPEIVGGICVAPMLGPFAPSSRKDFGGWAKPLAAMYWALAFDFFKLPFLRHRNVIRFSVAPEFRQGSTPEYSFLLYKGMHLRGLKGEDMSSVRVPCLLAVGEKDEIFLPEGYRAMIEKYAPDMEYREFPNLKHINVMYKPEVFSFVAQWISGLLKRVS